MTFDEAVMYVNANRDSECMAIGLEKSLPFLSVFRIWIPDDLGASPSVAVMYEGGLLFDSCGDEDQFSLDETPRPARELRYFIVNDALYLNGESFEYMLAKLFPDLPDPSMLITYEEKKQFADMVRCYLAAA